MTRLFIRFYLGVMFILFVAWSVQSYVFRERSAAANVQVVEQALGGGAKLARESLLAVDGEDRAARLEELQQQFDYSVTIVSGEEIPSHVRDRFAAGDLVALVGRSDGAFIQSPLANADEALQLGPLPTFVGPSQVELTTGLGLILLLAAGAIALLLRPVANQLRLVEQAATAIAQGDFSARVDERKVKSAATLAHAFNNMAARTEGMLRTQRELLQAVSHELRTPLSRIHFAIDLIRDAPDGEQRATRLDALDAAAQDLDELVGELLGYVRMESSDPKLIIDPVQLRPVLDALLEKHSLLHPTIHFELGQEFITDDVTVSADRTGLERSLGNLIGNAGRFAKSQVIIQATTGASGVVIDVDDDGPGIPEADRERVFEPFVRIDESSRGAGLGLALVRRIVGNHGGTVTALSNPAGGCRIRMVWPSAAE